jgi:hypothetical protein
VGIAKLMLFRKPKAKPGVPALAVHSLVPTVGAATSPNVPPPGLAGLAMQRDMQLPTVKGTLPDMGARSAPAAGTTTGGAGVSATALPVNRNADLSDPRSPTTADPIGRYVETPRRRHARLYPRMPDIGGTAPWQGERITVGGGIPTHPKSILADVEMPSPGMVASGKADIRGIRNAIAAERRRMKPITTLRPGLGGLDVAMGARLVPDTPSGVRETIRDVRGKRLHGAMSQHQTVPASVVRDRAQRGMRMLPPSVLADDAAPRTAPDSSSGAGLNLSRPPAATAAPKTSSPITTAELNAQEKVDSGIPTWAPIAAVVLVLYFMSR